MKPLDSTDLSSTEVYSVFWRDIYTAVTCWCRTTPSPHDLTAGPQHLLVQLHSKQTPHWLRVTTHKYYTLQLSQPQRHSQKSTMHMQTKSHCICYIIHKYTLFLVCQMLDCWQSNEEFVGHVYVFLHSVCLTQVLYWTWGRQPLQEKWRMYTWK